MSHDYLIEKYNEKLTERVTSNIFKYNNIFKYRKPYDNNEIIKTPFY